MTLVVKFRQGATRRKNIHRRMQISGLQLLLWQKHRIAQLRRQGLDESLRSYVARSMNKRMYTFVLINEKNHRA